MPSRFASSLRIVTAALTLLLVTLPLGTHRASAQIACEQMTSPVTSPEATPASGVPDATFPDGGGTLTIFAAASLTDAFATMETMLEGAHPDLDIVIETGGSQTLVTQLQEGARADVLATANTSTMQTAVDSGLIDGEPVPFTGNRLVIVAPEDNPAGIASIDDLANDGVHLVVAGKDVPAGAYAQQALCAYDHDGTAPDGFLDGVWSNIVSEEQDVRSVLAKVQIGEADAGIVYASDAEAARLSGQALHTIEFPETVPTTALYPIAPVAGGNAELANAFVAYILGDEGQRVLAEYGFSPVR
jgi:molybdate transport system substrate-binding protein